MSTPSPMSPPVGRLDTRALADPVDKVTLRAFAAESRATDKPWRQMSTGLRRVGAGDIFGQLIPIVIPLAGMIFLVYTGGPSLLDAVWRFTLESPFPLNLVIIGFAVLILLGVLASIVGLVRMIISLIIPRWWWESAYRLVRFAAANGLRYGHDEPVSYPGLIFDTGRDRIAERRLISTTGRRLEIANYRYTLSSGDGQSSQVYGWGYVAITLDRRLPHLVLDAKDNNNRSTFGLRTSNLPIDLAGDQKLSLGGEFDDKFTLYAPRDYGRDAFYIFAPDLMALFIDRLGTFDVEIIDDMMFVYGRQFDLLDPRTYDWLQELVETVVARTVRRTERYSDDRAPLESAPALMVGAGRKPVFTQSGDGSPGTVAAGGRRLRRGGWGLTVFLALLIIGYLIYLAVAPMFGLPILDG